MDFPRIKRLPPYVFNVIGDLCHDARRAGEDVIDFGMGNPDGATPPHIVNKLVEASAKTANHRYSVSRGIFKLRLAICSLVPAPLRRGSRSRLRGDRHHRLQGRYRAPGAGDSRPWRRGAGAHPDLSDPSVCLRDCRGRGPRRPLRQGSDFFEELVSTVKRCWPRPKFIIMNFPHNPTTAVVDLNFMKKVVEFAQRQPNHGGARFRLRRPVLRRLPGALVPPGARRQRRGRRVLHPVQELQHARMAGGIRGRQSRNDRGAVAAQILL